MAAPFACTACTPCKGSWGQAWMSLPRHQSRRAWQLAAEPRSCIDSLRWGWRCGSAQAGGHCCLGLQHHGQRSPLEAHELGQAGPAISARWLPLLDRRKSGPAFTKGVCAACRAQAGAGRGGGCPHLEALGDNDARCGQHGPPRVQQLVRPVLLHLRRLLAQAERVIPVAARHSARVGPTSQRSTLCVAPARAGLERGW